MLDHLISWAALLFSGISIIIAMRVQRRQPELIAKQITALDTGTRQRHEAHIVVELQRHDARAGIGGSFHLIRIINNGPAEARRIDIQFPDGNSPLPPSEAAAKLPIPVLQAAGRCDFMAAISRDHAPPFHVVLSWEDGLGRHAQETTIG